MRCLRCTEQLQIDEDDDVIEVAEAHIRECADA